MGRREYLERGHFFTVFIHTTATFRGGRSIGQNEASGGLILYFRSPIALSQRKRWISLSERKAAGHKSGKRGGFPLSFPGRGKQGEYFKGKKGTVFSMRRKADETRSSLDAYFLKFQKRQKRGKGGRASKVTEPYEEII